MLVQKRRLFGAVKTGYETKVLKLEELAGMNLAKKKQCGMVIQELILSKFVGLCRIAR